MSEAQANSIAGMDLEALTDIIKGNLSRSFDLLDDSKSRWFLVFFCGIFSIFFIVFYNPLNIADIDQDTEISKVLSIWSIGLWGAVILSFTQFFLRKKLRLNHFTLLQFALWLIFEIFLLSIFFFLIFRAIEKPLFGEFLIVLKYTTLLTFIPYSIACLLIAVVKMSNKIKARSDYASSTSFGLLILKDENGKAMLSIEPQRILFFKSENNYTSVFFSQESAQVQKKLIRSSLKKIQLQLNEAQFMRIHRSYIVNLQNVSSINREKGELKIKIHHLPDLFIKVSETYKNSFTEFLQMK